MVDYYLRLFVICSVLALPFGSSRNLPIISFDDGYSQLFGDDNLMILKDDYTAGVVVAYYMSNGDIFKKIPDELAFEFLGNFRGKDWGIQTNVYGNGSTNIGREERQLHWLELMCFHCLMSTRLRHFNMRLIRLQCWTKPLNTLTASAPSTSILFIFKDCSRWFETERWFSVFTGLSLEKKLQLS
ncbi:hypothetical protein F0562_003414 [Nyssa sinensis]|uniref:GH16 domain-containing protein n=1 Tax=Nyssa sinensis TaxID=561372 RepID=A0A5J5BVC2_9ASTE|nr:hypothetical protein F0562_003414 [Nyssa sinensis]